MDDITYTVSEIATAIGEKPRTVQFWTDMGVLRPQDETFRKGKGTRRMFNKDQLQYAQISATMSAMNSPLTEIIAVVDRLKNLETNKLHYVIDFDDFRMLTEKNGGPQSITYDPYLQIIELSAVYGISAFPSHIIVVYHSNGGENFIQVRLWGNALTENLGDVFSYSCLGVNYVHGIKAVRCESFVNELSFVNNMSPFMKKKYGDAFDLNLKQFALMALSVGVW